jgi:hypothetical protein
MEFGQNPVPETTEGWVGEIADAYCDAYETIPFGVFTGEPIKEEELFHVAPQICLKLRGIEMTPENLGRANEAMLASYTVTKEQVEGVFDNPLLVFAFAYLASHFGMKLLAEDKVSEIMEFLEMRPIKLIKAVRTKIRKTEAKNARLTELFRGLQKK